MFLVTICILQVGSESLKIHRAMSLLLFCKNQMGDSLSDFHDVKCLAVVLVNAFCQ